MSNQDKPFFVGYLPAPRELRAFLMVFGLSLVVTFAVSGWLVGASHASPGPGAFKGGQNLKGILREQPYPTLQVVEGTKAIPAGRTILLSGNAKTGVQARAANMDGQYVQVSGVRLERGELDMIQVRGGKRGLNATEGDISAAVVDEPLGRWRLAGEICDGKCYAGAMRPGTGLAHRACANMCLSGGVPPVFVSSQPVEGTEFLLIGAPDGGPATEWLPEYTAVFLSAEGELVRRGDLLIFLIEPPSVKTL